MSIPSDLARGALAGLVATGAMTMTMWGAERLGMLGEPPPRKITRAALRKVAPGVARDSDALDIASVITHFAFGAGMGALYGILPQHAQRSRIARGMLFGSGIWTTSYMGWVPALGIMKPPSEDRPGRPTAMLAAHWVFGTTLSAVFARMVR